MSPKAKKYAVRTVQYILLGLLALICIAPFYIMLINATRKSPEIVRGISLIPGPNLVENFQALYNTLNITGSLMNSVFIAVPSTLLTAYFGTMAAYGFAKFRFKGRNFLYAMALCTLMIPMQLSMLGIYQVAGQMRLLNTFWPIVLPAICNVSTVFWMRSHMQSVMDSAFIEAARIDGYSELGIFHNIVLPLSKAGLLTISIFNFVGAWNDYMGPLMFLSKNDKFPLSLAVAIVRQAELKDQGVIYAAVTFTVLPTLLVYLFLNQKITSGVTAGGVKG